MLMTQYLSVYWLIENTTVRCTILKISLKRCYSNVWIYYKVLNLLAKNNNSLTVADINKALLAKRKRLEMYTKASLKTSNQKIEFVWKTQQEQRSVSSRVIYISQENNYLILYS